VLHHQCAVVLNCKWVCVDVLWSATSEEEHRPRESLVGESAGNEIWAQEGNHRRQEEIAGALSVCVKWPEREADNSPVYIVDT